MKKKLTNMLAALCAAPVLFSGCQNELVPDGPQKVAVRIADAGQTRTSYDNVEGKFAWSEGDEIALHYQNGKYETYTVSVNSDPATGSIISSTVGGKVRNDFAVYPASAAVATENGAAPKVLLPAEYDLTALTVDDEHFSPAILVAENDPDEDLDFYHAGGLVRFMLTDIPAATTKITVTFDKEVAGEFEVVTDDADEPLPYIETRDGENTQVAFTVSSDVISSDGSLELNLPVPCGTYAWVEVRFLDASESVLTTLQHASPLDFSRHHGKRVAFVETEAELYLGDQSDPASTSLGKITVPSGTPTVSNDGGIITLSPAFVSYLVNGETVEKVPFKIQYSTNNRTWTDELPEWLSAAGTVDLSGSVPAYPQELSIVIDPLKNLIPMTAFGVPMPSGSRTANLQAKDPVSGVVDLSTINVATGATVTTTTANCYVVGAPGTYKFPTVYGNGVKNGEPNEDAYHAKMKNSEGEYVFRPDEEAAFSTVNPSAPGRLLGLFKDHKDNLIRSPYIAEQLGTSNFTARVLWMDQPGLIESVTFDAGGSGAEDDCIQFTITHEGIAQGNALIGLLDQNGTIVWSWHIWVTDEDLSQTKNLKGFKMAPVNIGWCNQVQIAKYQRLTCYVRIVQDYTGGKVSNSVKIVVGTTSNVYRHGNNPLYQPGRKDPIVGADGERGYIGNKAVYPLREENPYYPQYALLEKVTLGESIQYPYKHYQVDAGETRWLEITYGNVWNATQTFFGTSTNANLYKDPVTKTIYDPSPVGYKVPGPSVFRNLTHEEVLAGSVSAQSNDGVGVHYYQVEEVPLVAIGIREKYYRYYSSGLFRYSTATTSWDSDHFVGRDFYFHSTHGSCNFSTANYAKPVLCSTDE